MSVNTIYNHGNGMRLVVPSPHADGVRVTNDNGDYVDVYYDNDKKCWTIEASRGLKVGHLQGVTTLELT